MRMKIDSDSALMADDMRLRDPDAYVLLETLRWRYGERDFIIGDDDARALLPSDWSRARFTDTKARLIKSGYLVAVKPEIRSVT